MRRVWIEMKKNLRTWKNMKSPSMRRVWIEMPKMHGQQEKGRVTLHAEGVD